MSTHQISEQAASARESHRNPDGTFGNQPMAESEVSLPPEMSAGMRAAVAELNDLDDADRILSEQGLPEGHAARRLIASQHADLLDDITTEDVVNLASGAGAGKTVAYSGRGTMVFTDGSWAGYSASSDPAAPPTGPQVASSTDADVQAGALHDTVVVDGTTFHRLRPGINPGVPCAFRFQADRPLSDAEVQQAAQLVGYSYAANVRGEPLGDPVRDTPYSFVVGADTTTSRSDDIGMALEEFEEDLPVMFEHGSPVRKTDRAGAGTKGTRLVEGFGDSTPTFEIYADDVWDNGYDEVAPQWLHVRPE